MLPKVHLLNPGSDYLASSRRRALTWASLLGSGLIANLASAAPTNTPHGAGDDGTKPIVDAHEDIRTKQQVATDSSAVTDVIMRERFARETHDWAEDAACFHSDAIVEVSWFKGSGAEFVEAGKNNPDTETVHFDSMSPGVVRLKGEHAIADTACAVHTFSLLEGIEVSTTSYTRLLWRVQRSEGQWLIRGLRGIYIRDTLIPRDPNKVPNWTKRSSGGFAPPTATSATSLLQGEAPPTTTFQAWTSPRVSPR